MEVEEEEEEEGGPCLMEKMKRRERGRRRGTEQVREMEFLLDSPTGLPSVNSNSQPRCHGNCNTGVATGVRQGGAVGL